MAVSFLRTVIIFTLLLVSMRVMGKRQLGELEPFELVVAVLISNLASQPLGDIGIPLLYGVVPVLTLIACQLLISSVAVKSIRFRRILCGRPSILISGGEISEEEMKRSGLSPEELFAQLRRSGISDIRTVKDAVLETDGTLSIITYEKDSPATPSDLGLNVEEPGLPITVISDGRTIKENLKRRGLNEKWLEKQLRANGIKRAKDVYIMTVDEKNTVYLTKKGGKK